MNVKPRQLSLLLGLILASSTGFSVNLLQVYQQAQQHDATYQAAAQTYLAAKEGLPIARSALLPQVSLTGNLSYNYGNPRSSSGKMHFKSNQYQLQLTQTLFDLYQWRAYTQSDLVVKQAAITYEQAKETLTINVAQAYFAVLEAKDQVDYATTYRSQLKQQLRQSEQQYKVGLKALTDVQSTRASYESAVADAVAAENTLHNAQEDLSTITGHLETNLAPLKHNLPLLKPDPANPTPWVKSALKQNLKLMATQAQSDTDFAAISTAKAGNGTIAGYYPTINVTGTYSRASSQKDTYDQRSKVKQTGSAEIGLTYNIYNGGITKSSVQQARYTHDSDLYNLEQAVRNTRSQTRQSYLTVLSDISQVKALNQAVISGMSSLKAVTAAYQVGTRTIVDLLTQQSGLFKVQQSYAKARYSYITDSLGLKQVAGILSEKDIIAINKWLQSDQATTKKASSKTNK